MAFLEYRGSFLEKAPPPQSHQPLVRDPNSRVLEGVVVVGFFQHVHGAEPQIM